MRNRKIKILIAGTITALLLTGVAFASWADEITVEAMAASGEMNIEVTGSEIHSVSSFVDFTNSNIQIAENKKSVNVAIGNNYPGSQVKYSLTITNTGTLPIKLTQIVNDKQKVIDTKTLEDFGQDSELFSYMNIEYYIDVYNTEGVKIDSTAIVSADDGWVETFFEDNDLCEINPGEYIKLYTLVNFSSDAPNSTENKAFSFSVKPMFSQFG